MQNDNPIQEKSYNFSLAIIPLCQKLQESQKEYIISKQLFKSWTSIWANVEEAIGWFSRADFSAKMGIAYKEARESSYWLRLLRDIWNISSQEFETIHWQCEEILRILTAILKTSKIN